MGRWHKCLTGADPTLLSPVLPDDEDMAASFLGLYSPSSDYSFEDWFDVADGRFNYSLLSISSSESSFDSTEGSLNYGPYCDSLDPSLTSGTFFDTSLTLASRCMAIATTALVFCHTFGPENIDRSRIGHIARTGPILHRCCALRHGSKRIPPNSIGKLVTGRFICDFPPLDVMLKLRNHAFIENEVDLYGILVLRKLEHFLTVFGSSNFQFANFTFDDELSVAFIQRDNFFFLLECNWRRISVGILPSMRKFDTLDLAYEYLKNDVLPTPFDELDKYVYSIDVFDIITV